MHRRLLSLVVLLWIAGPLSGQAPTETTLTPAAYLEYETVAEPRLSPDGRQVVYTRRWINKGEDRWESALWIMDADGGRNRFFAKGSSPVWSPDGTRVAYLAEGEPKGSQIFVRWIDRDGPPTQVTREAHAPAAVRWSPDGRSLGFARFTPTPTPWTVEMPSFGEGAKLTPAPRITDRLHYRADRTGYLDPGVRQIFVVAADGGTPRAVTPETLVLGAQFDALPGGVTWDWMPDGRAVVVEGYQGNNDLIYRDSHIFSIDVVTGAVRQLTQQRGTWTSPRVSPDGRRIAFAGYEYTKQTYRAADLYLMNADGSGITLLSGAFDRAPAQVEWATDNSGVYFTAENEGSMNLHFAPVGGGVRPVTTGTHMLALGSVTRAGVAVATRSTYHKPPDVVRINLRKPSEITQLTFVNDDLLANRRLGEVEEFWYRSSGDARIQGWIVRPPDYDPAKKYPLLLEIHGGPHGMYSVGFDPLFQWMAARGYVVLYTNPRGSTGYGTAFGNAINHAYPSVDYDDLMAGVDTLLARGLVDPARMYVAGCSGGGVLSSWVIGHTSRFAGAAVRCPVTNWLSFTGQTDVPLFVANFFEKPWWDDPQPWLRQSSLMYVGKVDTPTLLMTGVLDMRTPMPQTEEFYAALKMRGVPTALMRFEGEWHGTSSRPSNFLRTVLYMDSWFSKYSR
ncbi:MAG TPA: S9 family peptidase [Gemmatimonadales bacterium]